MHLGVAKYAHVLSMMPIKIRDAANFCWWL